MKKCLVSWCDNTVKSRGLCSRHYERLRCGKEVEGEPTRRSRGEGGRGKNGYIYQSIETTRELEHRVIAAVALGRLLVGEECVHHVDEDRANNAKNNLVICPNKKYHSLLHRRMEAQKACGNPNWRRCKICGNYSAPDDPDLWFNEELAQHRSCNRAHVAAIRTRQNNGD